MSRATTLTLVLSAAISLFAQPSQTPAAPAAGQAAPQPLAGTTKELPDSAHVVILSSYPALYSDAAENKKLHGIVALEIMFNESGSVEEVTVVSGDSILAQCARDSAIRWRIEPFVRGGQPVRVKMPLSFEFIYEDPGLDFLTGERGTPAIVARADRIVLSRELAQKHIVNEKRARPEYPEEAKRNRIQGTVIFAAVVGTDGTLQRLSLVSGPALLAKAASDAVRNWHYTPFVYHEHAVAHDIRIDVHFVLGG